MNVAAASKARKTTMAVICRWRVPSRNRVQLLEALGGVVIVAFHCAHRHSQTRADPPANGRFTMTMRLTLRNYAKC
jgi:hypothetical protein